MNDSLGRLTSNNFLADLVPISVASGLRSVLARREEVLAVREALRRGEIDGDCVREGVRGILASFVPGRRFSGDISLAAVAVVLEPLPMVLADEFLEELSNLRIAECPLAPRVAKLAIASRADRVAGLTVRTTTLSRAGGFPRAFRESIPIYIGTDSRIEHPRLAS